MESPMRLIHARKRSGDLIRRRRTQPPASMQTDTAPNYGSWLRLRSCTTINSTATPESRGATRSKKVSRLTDSIISPPKTSDFLNR